MNDWPLKSVHQETVRCFERQLSELKSNLGCKAIYIWGAGVRGTLLGMLLERRGYSRFSYIDGDARKWGMNICNHMIDSVKQLDGLDKKDFIILVPLEYPQSVKDVLEQRGMIEQENFYIITSTEKKSFINEFFKNYNKKILLIGGSIFDQIPIEEADDENLKSAFCRLYGAKLKPLSINSMSIGGYYFLLRMQLLYGMIPEQLWLFLSWDLLTNYNHLLPRSQHADLFEEINSRINFHDLSFELFIKQAKERAANYKLELKYSPVRAFKGNRPSQEQIHRDYLNKSLLYSVDSHTESYCYLEKIMHLCNEYHIKCILFMIPYNYQLVKYYCGEQALSLVSDNFEKINKLCNLYGVQGEDLGGAVLQKDFETEVTVNDALFKNGRLAFLRAVQSVVHID